MSEERWEVATLEGGERVSCHAAHLCSGEACCIHNPSNHHMRNWPQHWRGDRRMMERICPHGVGHPDPDDLTEDRMHGCDGCCSSNTVVLERGQDRYMKWFWYAADGAGGLCHEEFARWFPQVEEAARVRVVVSGQRNRGARRVRLLQRWGDDEHTWIQGAELLRRPRWLRRWCFVELTTNAYRRLDAMMPGRGEAWITVEVL